MVFRGDGPLDTICRIVATANSLNTVWPDLVSGYTPPKTVIFAGSITTRGCGAATSAVGPFYCPADRTAYFDPSFFTTLHRRLGGSDGPLAQEYVVAQEFGHHLQNLLGISKKADAMGSAGPASGSVRPELQADCFAGVWAYHADKGPDAMLEPLTQRQIADVIQTTRVIGDDTLSGNRNSEKWTLVRPPSVCAGSPPDITRAVCDTFATNRL